MFSPAQRPSETRLRAIRTRREAIFDKRLPFILLHE